MESSTARGPCSLPIWANAFDEDMVLCKDLRQRSVARAGARRFLTVSTMMPPSHFFPLILTVAAWALATSASAQWRPVTFTNPELRAKGTITGDGCQWFRAVAIAPTDGDFMLWCTDVGGLFRSLDGGKNWEPTNVGFHSRGSAGVAIDPHNASRVLVVAANSVPTEKNGIYLSTDKAASWKQVLPVEMSGTRDMRRQIVFDPSTFDPEANLTRVAYWSRLGLDTAHNPAWGKTVNDPAFYKSSDGGVTWERVPGGEAMADSQLAVHPTRGWVYAINKKGLFVSRDGAATWERLLEGEPRGIAVSAAAPDSVWINFADRILRSDDNGATFTPIAGAASIVAEKSSLADISVSAADPKRINIWRSSPNWHWPRFTSSDGGLTWVEAKIDKSRVIVPTNSRQGITAIHPTNPDIVLTAGGDYPMISRDGGRTFTFAGNGVNNIFIGGAFNFSAVNPDVIYLGSQDYATLLSTDNGENWTYLEPGQKGWGGYNYATYASTPDALIAGETEHWGGPLQRALSFDRGATWSISKELIEPKFSYGDPRDAKVLFAGNQRSADGGRTWKAMTGATSVRTHDPSDGTLYGVREAKDQPNVIVTSSDHGQTWNDLFTLPGWVADVAVDHQRGRVYVAAGDKLHQWEKASGEITEVTGFVSDQTGRPRILSVAVDPVDPSVIYIAGNRNIFASNASAQRSIDAGRTWENLIRQEPLDGKGLDGGRESQFVRVNPKTREPWFATNCYGVWIHAAPPAKPEVTEAAAAE